MLKVITSIISSALLLANTIPMANAANTKTNVNTKTQVAQKTYKNSLQLPKEWDDYGIGDPYVFRNDGKYYLYCSTKDSEVGIKCWSSEDLTNWKYEGLVATDPITTGAYAPEVVYWNGYYYMYTSPGGNGHYALKSTSPTGPFKIASDNFGQSIDGDVFIDDNGKWYFNHAGQNGIVQNTMSDPLKVDPNGYTIENAFLNGWTEGPGIIKRNGMYYMTYTGNHVKSDGYRVNYAVSKQGPDEGYKSPENNPIVISTDPDFNGLGHSSTVMGPDMDSYYIIYHNLTGSNFAGAPTREMNIDRIVFNGEKMSVLGPTNFTQPAPKSADFKTWIKADGANKNFKLSKDKNYTYFTSNAVTDKNFTAEFNFNIATAKDANANSEIGFIFSYNDSNNYLNVSLDTKSKKLSLNEMKNGKLVKLGETTLFNDTDLLKLHTVRIEKNQNHIKVYFDNLSKIEKDSASNIGGKIGYMYNKINPVFDYTAFSNDSNGTSDYEVYKPIPGNIESTHFLKGNGRGYLLSGVANAKDNSISHDKLGTLDGGSYFMTLKSKGDFLKYNINVSEKANYGLDIMLKGNDVDTNANIYIDDKIAANVIIPATNDEHVNQWVKVNAAQLNINSGYHTLKIETNEGKLQFKYMSLYKADNSDIDFSDPLTTFNWRTWTKSGLWNANSKGLTAVDPINAKAYTGKHEWTDYEIGASVTLKDTETIGDGGLLFRVTNESTGYRQQATEDLTGYYAGISKNTIFLKKLNYGSTVLVSKDIKILKDHAYNLKVRVYSNLIKVYLDNPSKPVIQYHDHDALTHGKVGLFSSCSEISFNDFSVSNDSVPKLDMEDTTSYNEIGVGAQYSHKLVEAADKADEVKAQQDKATTNVGLATTTAPSLTYNFDNGKVDAWKTYGGTWAVKDGQYNISKDGSGKALTGDENWRDYTVEADLKVGDVINSGVLFRVTKPGNGPDEMKGYFAGFNPDGVILGKEDNKWSEIKFIAMPVKKNGVNHIKVEAVGNSIKVYAGDDMKTPKIDVTDDSFIEGAAGIRSHFAEASFDNFSVSNITKVVAVTTVEPVVVQSAQNIPTVSVPSVNYNFNDGKVDAWKTYGGTWTAKDGQYNISKDGSGKALTGDENWKDYTVEADVKVGDVINSGIIFRVTKPGNGPDEMKGYFAGFSPDGVVLGKEDNAWTTLKFQAMPVKKNGINHIKVEVVGNSIKVYAGDDMKTPKIDVTDDSFIEGAAGIRSHFAEAGFDNFNVTNIKK